MLRINFNAFYLPKPCFNLLNSHSIALEKEEFVCAMSQHNLTSISRVLSTSSLSSSLSEREFTGAKPSQNTMDSFNSSHRQKMMGIKCFLRNCSLIGTDTVAMDMLRSLRESTVGMLPCMLVLLRKGSTAAPMNSWMLRSGVDSEGPDCMNSWGRRRTSCYAKIIFILRSLDQDML